MQLHLQSLPTSLMAPIITFSYLTLLTVQNHVSVFERPLYLYFTAKLPKIIALHNWKQQSFVVINWKVFRISKKHWYSFKLLLFSYKTAKFQEKLLELEPRVSHSFGHKNSLKKKAFKSFGTPSNPLPVKFFCFKILLCVWDITIFFPYFKALLLIYPYG